MQKFGRIIEYACIALLLLLAVVFTVSAGINGNTQGVAHNYRVKSILGNACGTLAVLLCAKKAGIRLFSRPQSLLYCIPCLIVAVNNFPFISYVRGLSSFIHFTFWDIALFAVYCFSVALFEEIVFRGILFTLIAERVSQDKKGLIKTLVISSCVFGCMHIFNAFGGNIGGAILQVGYSTLTGGMFAFVWIKTKNILFPTVTHAVYNFCGLLLSEQGLGGGIVWDIGTIVLTAVIAVLTTLYVLFCLYKHTDGERAELYTRIGINKGESPNDQVEEV